MTSSADAPIEPVAPRMAMLRAGAGAIIANQVVRDQRRRRHRGGQRIDAVEHAAVAGQNGAAVLDAALTLQLRLEQIADDRQSRQQQRRERPRSTAPIASSGRA